MNRVAPAGITAWSWVSPLGSFHSDEQRPSLEEILSKTGLAKHASHPDVFGYVGSCPDELPALPEAHRHRDSRCARLLYRALLPLLPRIKNLKEQLGPERIAIVLGSSTGGIDATETALQHRRKTGDLPPDYRFRQAHPYDSLLELAAELLEITGPSLIVSTACSSAAKAMASAARLLHTGFADAALVGGADALCEMTVRGFAGLGVLSEKPCWPFAEDRSGTNIGEGAALLLFEANSKAPIQFLGSGESSDAYHSTTPHPEGLGAKLALSRCLASTGIDAGEVDYVNAHGTGTRKNDAMEALAIADVLGKKVSFSSTKDRTGHQLGTAGATEAIICVQAIEQGSVPRSLAMHGLDGALAAAPTSKKPPGSLSLALSNSFAFGGSNVTVAIGRPRADSQPRSPANSCYVRSTALWSPRHTSPADLGSSCVPEAMPKPPAHMLPLRTRGRSSTLTRIFAELYDQLLPADPNSQTPHDIPTIFASCFGEMETTLTLLRQMAEALTLSPLRFQASVHNTAAGRISLQTHNRSFSTALAAGQTSFAMALLEAQAWLGVHGGDVLVLLADEALPDELDADSTFPPAGVGLHLTSSMDESVQACLAPLSQRRTLAKIGCETGPVEMFRDSPATWGARLLQAIREKHTGELAVGPHFDTILSF